MTQTLRPYQHESLDRLRSNLRRGVKAQVLFQPTGSGKTTVASAIFQGAAAKGNRAFFVVDSLELVDQAAVRFAADGMDVGVIQGNHHMTDYSKPIQVATVQTLKNRWDEIAAWLKPDVMIVDECFVAGTRVATARGQVRIEDVQPGDKVFNATGLGTVEAFSVQETQELVSVEVSNGEIIECTSNHPFFTESGWIEAGALEVGSVLFGHQELRDLWDGDEAEAASPCGRRETVEKEGLLQRGMCGKTEERFLEGASCEESKEALPFLRDGNDAVRPGVRSVGSGLQRKKVLLDILCMEAQEPYAQQRNQRAAFPEPEGDRASPQGAGRKWARLDGTTESPAGRAGERMGGGTYSDSWTGQGQRLPKSLQAGSCTFGEEDSNRGGWSVARSYREADAGPKERRVPAIPRVVGVSRKKCGSPKTVYNLQVSGHPSYFANGVLVHNCHVLHSAHEKIIAECKNLGVPVIGLSATPFRKGLGTVFDTLVVGSTTQSLTDQGYLVPATYYAPFVPDLKGVKTTSNGDWQEDALADYMGDAAIVGDVIDNWFKLSEGRQTIVFAANVAHSRLLCDAFQKRGIVAAHVDGYDTDKEARKEKIDAFRRGETQVLTNCAVLTKGFDAPETACIVVARPTKSLMLHVQMIGRGLRTADGKRDCIVIDHAGNCLRNGLATDALPEELDDGTSSRNLDRKERDKKDPVAEPCMSCGYVSTRHKCPACGFAPEARKDVEVRDGELYEITTGETKKWTPEKLAGLYAELLGYARKKGYNPGWAFHKCREHAGRAPKATRQIVAKEPSPETMGIIKHLQIKNAKRRAA